LSSWRCFFAILLLIAGNWRRLADLRASLDQGADASVLPIFNTASLVGFGAVIAALPVFDLISEAVLAVGGGNPLVSVAASVTVLSAMTGSASRRHEHRAGRPRLDIRRTGARPASPWMQCTGLRVAAREHKSQGPKISAFRDRIG
jgi:hypothetical protein